MSVVVLCVDTCGPGELHIAMHLTHLGHHISVYLPTWKSGNYNIKSERYDAVWGNIRDKVVIPSKEDGNEHGLSEELIYKYWLIVKLSNNKRDIQFLERLNQEDFKEYGFSYIESAFGGFSVNLFGFPRHNCVTLTTRLLKIGKADEFYSDIDNNLTDIGTLLTIGRKMIANIDAKNGGMSVVKDYVPPKLTASEKEKKARAKLDQAMLKRLTQHF